MTFPVQGDTPEARRRKIETVFALSPMAGFLLSAVNLEWTLRRSILALGRDPTAQIRKELERKHGTDGYKDLWKEQVAKPFKLPRLCALIENGKKSGTFGWKDVVKAFDVRHVLAHGRSCTQGGDYLKRHTDIFLETAEIVVAFVADHGGDVFSTIRRLKPRQAPKRK